MASAADITLTYQVDPRLPVASTLSPSDPNHPSNVIQKLLQTGNQATADSQYDNKPRRLPPGVTEGFCDWTTISNYLWILAILAILAALYLVTSFRSLVIKFACILVIVGSIHYLVSKLEKRAV
jgi:hypothetical protein